MLRFEVGKYYEYYDSGFDPMRVDRRTDKTIWVTNPSGHSWFMRIRKDEDGNEYAVDTVSAMNRWRDVFTISPKWECTDWQF